MSGLITAITDIKSFLYLPVGFPFKPRTDIVTSMAGTVKGITDDEFFASIGLFTVEAMDAEVVGVVKTSPVPYIYGAMPPNLFGDSRRIFAEIFGNFPEGFLFVKRLLDVLAIGQRKMFMVTRLS